ncbi:hypothetical protein F4808DRAFT_214135 [Astrocystis sublimbata]|nr:hypothetical protein F4808DRAFT_214135 [Astrocystis sublimbata]
MSFLALPLEIIGLVVTYLDFADILSLRLACRAMLCQRSIDSRIFAQKQVYLTPASLATLVQMTSPDIAGCVLQHCTITGLAGARLTPSRIEECKQLLTAAFRNLKEHSTNGSLASLRLHVIWKATHEMLEPEDEEPYMPRFDATHWVRWETALCTFNVTMAALQESGLRVDDYLNIFDDIEGCSLPYDALVSLSCQVPTTTVLSGLKRLNVSLSSPCSDSVAEGSHEELDRPIEYWRIPIQARHGTNALQGLLAMSTIMPSLESLGVHWYNLLDYAAATLDETKVEIQPQPAFKQLTSCHVRGLETTESDLLQFMKNLHPQDICLADISLYTGGFSSIFRYLTTPGIFGYTLPP